MNVAFEKPTIAVDTHVFRVANRTGYAKGKTPEIVQKKNGAVHSAPLSCRCSSLVHSARPLYLQSQKARMLEVPD